jgi:hypothetical protein
MAMDKNDGLINACGTSGCWNKLGATRCCDFQQGNYIVLYPGELEEAQAAGQPTAHLNITDENYHGGKKAICQARHTGTCDGGFKPFDCVSYPFFPEPPGDGPVDLMIKGKKCPLLPESLERHAAFIREAWNALTARRPGILAWLNKVKVVGYTEPERHIADKPTAVPQRDAA